MLVLVCLLDGCGGMEVGGSSCIHTACRHEHIYRDEHYTLLALTCLLVGGAPTKVLLLFFVWVDGWRLWSIHKCVHWCVHTFTRSMFVIHEKKNACVGKGCVGYISVYICKLSCVHTRSSSDDDTP